MSEKYRVETGFTEPLFGVVASEWLSFGDRTARLTAEYLNRWSVFQIEAMLDEELADFRKVRRSVPIGRSLVVPFAHGGSLNMFVWDVSPIANKEEFGEGGNPIPKDAEYFGMFPGKRFGDIWVSQSTRECFAFFDDQTIVSGPTDRVLQDVTTQLPDLVIRHIPLQLVAGAVLSTRKYAN